MVYDATTARIFDMPPYFFFYIIGIVFSSSLFILLLLKYNYSIPRYTKIFFLSGIGLLIGAKLFGFLTGLYAAFAGKEAITVNTFFNTGIVFYGGLIGFVLSFLLICKIWNKKVDYEVVDIAVVCVPLFHFWGRLGCFFAGCCYGIENHSMFSVLYTTYIKGEIVTASRLPVQFIEAVIDIAIFVILLILLGKGRLKRHLLKAYLLMYAIMRILLEFFRGDLVRGVWNGISFSQVVSVAVIVSCVVIIKRRNKNYV